PRPLTTGIRPYTLDITSDGKLAAVGNVGRSDGDIDSVSLMDLTSTPFRTVSTVSIDKSTPEGLKFSPNGKILAIGAQDNSNKPKAFPFYKDHGTLILFAVRDKHLHKLAEAPVGAWSQGIAFSKDGRTILVQNMVEKSISVFRWEGRKLVPGDALQVGAG